MRAGRLPLSTKINGPWGRWRRDRRWRLERKVRWTSSPALEALLPELSREEQLRLQNRLRERDRRWERQNKKNDVPPAPTFPSSSESARLEQERDAGLIPFVQYALRHYNARHKGGEFDPVKPLMLSHVGFRDQEWFHINFWACSRTNNKMIKCFFAEIHCKPPSTSACVDTRRPTHPIPTVEICIPTVETCTIIEEPLCQYKRSCGFCHPYFDILHPKGCRKFVCGNDKDRIYRITAREA